jgi:hypothetical protein
MVTEETLRQATDRLVEQFRPKRVILFGSQARGTADARSDVDLLVICPFDSKWENRRTMMVALDPTGQIIYAVSASGLTVLNLPQPLDQVPAMQWPLVVHSGNDKSALHGSITQRMAAMRDKLRK